MTVSCLADGSAQTLILDSKIFQVEAELRRLDHCEAVLSRRSLQHPQEQ
ncbi:hypothetical protein ACFFHJ_04370 [Planotetraspora thailandica]|nr:hypothetical protein [Planotetraspora thailandica]